MAGLGKFSIDLDEGARLLIEQGIQAVQALTEELRIHNTPPPEEIAEALGEGRKIHLTGEEIISGRFYSSLQPSRIEAVEEGSTIRVPEGMVAVMVPHHLMKTAVDAVLRERATEDD